MSVKAEPITTTSTSQYAPSAVDLTNFLRVDVNSIGNKAKKAELRARLKNEKAKLYKKHKKRKTDPSDPTTTLPPQPQRTIETMRVRDKTHDVDVDDAEYQQEMQNDEFQSYFTANNNIKPKIILTSNQRYLRRKSETYQLALCLLHILPNSYFYQRKTYTVQQIVEQAINVSELNGQIKIEQQDAAAAADTATDADGDDEIGGEGNEYGERSHSTTHTNNSNESAALQPFTDILILNEDEYKCNGLTHIHLPHGPTVFYTLRSLKLPKQLGLTAMPTDYKPEIMLNNFDSKLGTRIARMFSVLFDRQPEFKGRRVITFHNQRDYIFVRQHRYIFGNNSKGETKARLQEIGPRFTLKLKWLQSGTFDTQHGQYEFIRKKDTDETKRTFHL